VKVLRSEAYAQWIDNLRDPAGRARVLMRVDRLIHGNPGNHRNLTEGVSELKIDVGPGYRVYHSIRGQELLLLLAGGSKASQSSDIARALELNRSFLSDSP
jgi:putative addiction module killer protein